MKEGTSWETSPIDIAAGIAKSLAEKTVVARVSMSFVIDFIYSDYLRQVNGQLWDIDRPLEGSCKLELLDFEHPEGENEQV